MFKEHQHDPLLDSPEQRMKDRGRLRFLQMTWTDVMCLICDLYFCHLALHVNLIEVRLC